MSSKTEVRLFNFRKTFLIFLGLVVGIFMSYNFFVAKMLNATHWWFWAGVVFSFLLLLCSIVILLLSKKYHLLHRYCAMIINILICLVAFFVGIVIVIPSCTDIVDSYNYYGYGTVTAKITEVAEYEYGKVYVLSDVIVEDDSLIRLQGKCRMCSTDILEVSEGSIIQFYADVEANKIFKSSDVQKLINGYGYNIDLDEEFGINIINSSKDLKFYIKDKVRDVLLNNMTSTNASLSYSMLFGDKSVLSEQISDNFSVSGVMHLLAVSGLHVGLVSGACYAFISFITKKARLGYNVRAIINIMFVGLFLLFYAYLCNFSPSVIRATIMVLVFLICSVSGFKYDALSSLSIAGIIILCVSPLQLLSVGFQLSFLCIFAIITLVSKLSKFAEKLKIPKWLSVSLITSMSINLIIFPVMLNCFGNTSLISIVANIMIIPLFSIIFPILFFTTMISTVLGFLSFILFLPNIALQILTFLVDLFASIPFGVVNAFRVGYVCLALLIGFAFIFKFLMYRTRPKTILVSLLLVTSILVAVFNAIPAKRSGEGFLVSSQYGSFNSVFFSVHNGFYFGVPKTYNEMLVETKTNNPQHIILYDFEISDISEIKEYFIKNPGTIMFVSKRFEKIKDIFDGLDVKFYDKCIEVGTTTIVAVYDYSGDFLAFEILTQNKEVLYIPEDLSKMQYSFLGAELDKSYDYVLIKSADINIEDFDISAEKVIFATKSKNDGISLTDVDYLDIKL